MVHVFGSPGIGKRYVAGTHFSFLPPTLSAPSQKRGFLYTFLHQLNTWVCRVMYGVKAPQQLPIPAHGPALIVCDHTSLGDPLVLAATAGRPIRFLMAQEIYALPHIRWGI